MLTDFDLDLKVNIEDQALGRHKMNWVFRSTLFNAHVKCEQREATDC